MPNRVLVCLDDLQHSKIIASHTGHVIGAKDDFHITLFHCLQSDDYDLDLGAPELELSDTDKINIDRVLSEYYAEKQQEKGFYCQDVYNSAREILKGEGVSDNNITDKLVVVHGDIAAYILQEAYNNNHDIIVIGKRREIKLPITKLGVVAENVLTNAIGKTVWLVSIATSPWFKKL